MLGDIVKEIRGPCVLYEASALESEQTETDPLINSIVMNFLKWMIVFVCLFVSETA